MPQGTMKPDYYFLSDMNNDSESGLLGQEYLSNLLISLGINYSYRKFNLIRCSTESLSEDLLNSVRSSCSNYAKVDIFKTKPKVIITLGSEASKHMLGDKFSRISVMRGKLFDVEINGEVFKVIPTYSPTYVVSNESSVTEFMNDLTTAVKFVNGELVDVSSKELTYALSYDDFVDYYNTKCLGVEELAYDIETNARDPRSEQAKMVGFSLAPNGSTGIYVVRNSLEYSMPESDWDRVKEFMVNTVLPNHKLLVHNCMYELPFTYNEWGYYINNFNDTLIKSRLILGGKIGASLKERCMLDLGYPDWDTDLGIYSSSFSTLLKKLRPTSGGKEREDYTVLSKYGFDALVNYYNKLTSEEGHNKRTKECSDAVDSLFTLMRNYYTDHELVDIFDKIARELVSLISIDYDGVFSYGFIPMRIITRYGAMDTVGTKDLNVHTDKMIKKYSDELGINLLNGYEYMKQHYLSGTWMELSGLYWNDEVASKEKQWYNDKCVSSIRGMVETGFLDEYIISNNMWILNDYLRDNITSLEVSCLYPPHKIMKSGIKLHDGTMIRWKGMLDYLGPNYILTNKHKIIEYVINELYKPVENYKDLKWIFNPGSPKQENKDLLNSIWVSEEIKIAKLMDEISILLDDPSFNIEDYPIGDRALFHVLINSRKYNSYVDEYNKRLDDDSLDKDIMEELETPEYLGDFELELHEDTNDEDQDAEPTENIEVDSESSAQVKSSRLSKLSDRELFENFCRTLSTCQIMDHRLQTLIGDALNYKLVKIDEPSVVQLNSYFLITGIKLDDQSTWTVPYKFLINYRIWKKCNKMVTSYIDGSRIGRGSVWYVDKTSFQNGDLLSKRLRKWDGSNPEFCSTVMQSNYQVCTASSYRWKAGMHTIPTGAAIKNIYTSRYDGGVIAAPDFCLSADTRIRLTDGSCKRIRELLKVPEFSVFAYDEETKSIVEAKGCQARLVRYADDMYRLTFDNGMSVECTSNHKFYDMREQKMKECKDFHVGDSVLPLRLGINSRNELTITDPWTMHTVPVSQLSYYNNTKQFSQEVKKIWRSPSSNSQISSTIKRKKKERYREILEYFCKSEIVPCMHNWDNLLDNIDTIDTRGCKIYSINKEYNNFADFFLKESKGMSKSFIDNVTYKLHIDAHISKNMYSRLTKLYSYMMMRSMNMSSFTEWDININNLQRTRLVNKREVVTSSGLLKYFKSMDEVHRYCLNNHRIVKIERLKSKNVPVYCFTVPKYHNFFLACGILSANSQMELRTMAGAAKCESMIEAFRSGADIHLQNACFTGDTRVWLADGTKPTLEELSIKYHNSDEKFWVYSVDNDDNITFGQAHHPRLTRRNAKLVEVVLDNGTVRRCTPDHLWRTRDGYVQANDLVEGTSITPIYTKEYKGYEMYYDLVGKDFKFTHYIGAEISEPGVTYSGMVRHHKNCKKKDNRPENLMKMTWKDHQVHHQNQKNFATLLKTNPEEYYRIQKKAQKARWSKPENHEKQAKVYARVGREFLNGETGAFRNDPKYEDARRRTLEQGLKNIEKYRDDPIRKQRAKEALRNKKSEKWENNCRKVGSDPVSRLKGRMTQYNNKLADGLVIFSRPSRAIPNIVKNIKLCSELLGMSVEDVLKRWSNLNIKDITDKLYYNHKVVEVRVLDYTSDVYCMTVDNYENFAVDCSDGINYPSAVFVHNCKIFNKDPEEIKPEERRYSKMASFMILYGGDYHTFGNQFLGGDIALAKSIYDSFYSAYPEVADYIKAKHDEAKEHEKVTTLMEMFISLEANDPQFHGDENARMRLAQNAPIQSASSMLAGCCLYEIMKYIQDNNMKSKVILFVHDSIEVDIHPDEMLELGTKIIPLMNQFPNEKFNLPVKADLVLGKSIGQEVEIQSIECNDDYTEGWLECESTEEHFDALIDIWKSVYPVVEYEDIDEPKVKYKSWSDLWIPKLAIQKGYGEDYRIVHRKVHIKTKM